MKMRIQLIIENESGVTTTAQIAALERRESDDLIGISLEEAKTMTGSVQRALVASWSRSPENSIKTKRREIYFGSDHPAFGKQIEQRGAHDTNVDGMECGFDSPEAVRLLQASAYVFLKPAIRMPSEADPIRHDLRPILDPHRKGDHVRASQDSQRHTMSGFRQ